MCIADDEQRITIEHRWYPRTEILEEYAIYEDDRGEVLLRTTKVDQCPWKNLEGPK